MVMFFSGMNHGSSPESSYEAQWHVGNPFPNMTDVWIDAIQAEGHELDWIIEKVLHNKPKMALPRIWNIKDSLLVATIMEYVREEQSMRYVVLAFADLGNSRGKMQICDTEAQAKTLQTAWGQQHIQVLTVRSKPGTVAIFDK